MSAAQDPGVASELLATSMTLGGLPVTDNTSEGYEAVATALGSWGDWRFSARWRLDAWDPGDDVGTLAIARAAIAGWTDEVRSGLIVYVYGGALRGTEGLIGVPGPLQSYLLCVSRSPDGADTVDTVHRRRWQPAAQPRKDSSEGYRPTTISINATSDSTSDAVNESSGSGLGFGFVAGGSSSHGFHPG